MMNPELITAMIAFAFVASITPGPNNLMLMASGTNFGIRRTIPHMFGVGIGFMIMVVLVGVGVMKIFDAFPVVRIALKIAGVLYLLYLAWKIATASAPEDRTDGSTGNAKPMTFLQAALFQWVNPKAWAMALTAVSTYTPSGQTFGAVLVVAIVFGIMNLPAVTTWVVLGSRMRRFLHSPTKLRVFNISAALLLLLSLYPILFDH
jgi:threonine/homoserine/homoserine lactone efflux protein